MIENVHGDKICVYQALAKQIIRDRSNLRMVNPNLFSEASGRGLRKDDNLLKEQFNEFLREIQQTGLQDEMIKNWMDNPKPTITDIPVNPDGRKLLIGTNSGLFPFVSIYNG